MTVRQLVPCLDTVELEPLLGRLSEGAGCLVPFAPAVTEFCQALSRALFHDAEARRFPELQSLAFAMRKAELVRLEEEFRRLETPGNPVAPRGLVFHIPPANVDTMFIYSWLVSVLVGNRNVIRISASAAPQALAICRLFNAVLEETGGALRDNTCMLQYGHERDITAAISQMSDVRIIWGGDETVNTIRAIPIPPHSKEITFPDRYSFAAIHAGKYLAAAESEKRILAERFYNDTFWFDQMACSSPRLVAWCGSRQDAETAGELFFRNLEQEVARRGYQLEAGARVNRFTFACRAILDQNVTGFHDWGNQVTVLRLEGAEVLSREHCGGGLLFQIHAGELASLLPMVVRRDQTLTYSGFDFEELRSFARALNGRGIDRIVPVGQALGFEHHWDGYDLFAELTRQVAIRV